MPKTEPPGRIQGRAVLAGSGEPAVGASVRVLMDGVITDVKTTNRNGEFTSRLLFAGRYRVEVVHGEMRGFSDDVDVAFGETSEVEVTVR